MILNNIWYKSIPFFPLIISVSLVAALLCIMCAIGGGGNIQNLFKDASFEDVEKTSGTWEAAAGIDVVTVASGARGGRCAYLLKPKIFGTWLRQKFLDAGDISSSDSIVSFGVWARTDNEPANIKLTILNKGTTDNLSNHTEIYNNVSRNWQFFTVSTELNSKPESLEAYIYPDDGKNGGSENDIYIDGAIATKGKLKNIFKEGPSPGQQYVKRFRTVSLTIIISIVALMSLSMRFISPVRPDKTHIASRNISADRDLILAIIIFLTVMVILAITRNDVPINDNEWKEHEIMTTIHYWFNLLFGGRFGSMDLAEISERFWPYSSMFDSSSSMRYYHPPFTKYIDGISYLLFHNFMSPFECYRLGAGSFFALAAGSLYLFISRHYGLWAGLFSVFSLLLMPRIFTHAHFVGTDVPVAAMWALTAFLYYNSVTTWRKIVFSIVFGCALLTKVQAVFIPIPLILWSYYLHKLGRESQSPVSWSLFFSVSLITPVVVFLGWPWLWHNAVENIVNWTSWVAIANRDGQDYFGTAYSGVTGLKTPWHYPFVFLLITIPLPIVVMGIIGISMIYKDRSKDETGVLLFINMFIILLVISLHGGWGDTREFLAAFIFFAGIAGIGFNYLSEFILKQLKLFNVRLRERYFKTAFFALILLPALISLVHVFPYGLYYYNKFIGGFKGAQQAGLVTYWSQQYGKDLFNYMNTKFEKNARVAYYQGTPVSIRWSQDMGRIRDDIVLDDTGKGIEDHLNSGADYCIADGSHNQFIVNNIAAEFFLSYDGVRLVQILKRETIFAVVFPDIPAIQYTLNHRVGENIKLIGYNIDSRTSYQGGPIAITYFWTKMHDNSENLTTHFKLENSPLELNHTPSLDGFIPVKYWPPGKIFKERFEVKIPDDFPKTYYRALLRCNLKSQEYNKRTIIDLGEIILH